MMIHYLAEIITDFFVRKKVIKESDVEIYQYGNEMAVSTFFDILILFVIAFVTKEFLAVAVFWVSFFTLRKSGGGYHANSHLKCKIILIINLLLIIFAIIFLIQYYSLYVTVLLCLFSELVMCSFAPIENDNKPMTKKEKKANGIKCRIVSLIVVVISLLLYKANMSISFVLVLTLLSVSVAMIIELLRKEGRRNEVTKKGGSDDGGS